MKFPISLLSYKGRQREIPRKYPTSHFTQLALTFTINNVKHR